MIPFARKFGFVHVESDFSGLRLIAGQLCLIIEIPAFDRVRLVYGQKPIA